MPLEYNSPTRGAGVTSVGVTAKVAVQSRPNQNWLQWIEARTWALSLLLVVATVALYYPVHGHPFVNYDDTAYVTENPRVQAGLDWDTVQWAFTTYEQANWHPLTWLSHAVDCQLFQLDPAGPHVINLLLHVMNVLLLFWVLYRATGFAGRSFMVAGLFALHPINVQTVAWIAERKNLLSMMFFLLALGAYRWYSQKLRTGPYVVVALLFALGLMAKPQVITLPCVLLLWDYWPLQRMEVSGREASEEQLPTGMPRKSFSWLVMEKLPLVALAGASALITMRAQRQGGARNWFPRVVRVENAIFSYARYILKAVWPSKLALFYPHPDGSIKAWQVLGSVALLLAITYLVLKQPGRRYLTVGWLWFLGTLVPMLGLIQVGVQAMADRYAYLPFIGLFIMICWGVTEWTEERHISMRWLAAASIAALLALSVVARIQLDLWSDNVRLWAHDLEVTRGNFIAENSLGIALQHEGNVEEAIKHFRAAVEINPNDAASNLNIAEYDRRHGRLVEAIERCKRVPDMTQLSIQKAQAFAKMGLAYRELGDTARARECFEQAEKIQSGR